MKNIKDNIALHKMIQDDKEQQLIDDALRDNFLQNELDSAFTNGLKQGEKLGINKLTKISLIKFKT